MYLWNFGLCKYMSYLLCLPTGHFNSLMYNSDEQEYQLVHTDNMDEYFMDENKFTQLPWEDTMYVIKLYLNCWSNLNLCF